MCHLYIVQERDINSFASQERICISIRRRDVKMNVLAITSYIECFWVQSGNYSNNIIEIRTRWTKGKKI